MLPYLKQSIFMKYLKHLNSVTKSKNAARKMSVKS